MAVDDGIFIVCRYSSIGRTVGIWVRVLLSAFVLVFEFVIGFSYILNGGGNPYE